MKSTLLTRVHSITGATTIDGTLFLDGENDPNAQFIFRIQGALSSSACAKVKLINGTQACNVFWKIEVTVDINTNSICRGTIICNNAAIGNSGVLLDGRALITTGAVSTNETIVITTSIPTNCGELSVADKIASHTVSVYPNPLSEYAVIPLNDETLVNNSEVVIYDMLGKETMSVQLTIHLPSVSRAQSKKAMQ